jgi:hypothetical protein
MAEQTKPGCRTVCEGWSQAIAEALRYQWRLFDVPYQAGIQLLETLVPVRERPAPGVPVGGSPAESEDTGPEGEARFPTSPYELRELEQRALECARRGVALPRAVYDIRNRRRIDWSQFPEWARPVDPEVFTGSAHEG